jgi:pimeloyl-ACP methyl ester carboxylesterase
MDASVRELRRVRYAWTLGADWPRLAMVQAVAQQMLTLDPVVNDWAHIKAPTLAFGGAGRRAARIGRALSGAHEVPGRRPSRTVAAGAIDPGLGHVPHLEAPEKIYPPLVAFLKEGLASQ